LLNCCQCGMTTLLQALDPRLEPRSVFPSIRDEVLQAQKLKANLWGLQQFMTDTLRRREELNSQRIAERLTAFRAATLAELMYGYRDEFELACDGIVTANDRTRARIQIGRFIKLLERMMQEVASDELGPACRRGAEALRGAGSFG
jgi:hypothetical protein